MTLLHTWLSHNSLRQAYTAFDMDTPGDMPIRPILQVLRIGASSVTMGRKKVATLKYLPSFGVANRDFNAPTAGWDRIVV